MNHPNRIIPIIAGTMVMTLIQVTPVLNLINLLCCSGILLGGFAGVYIYNRQIMSLPGSEMREGVSYKDGGVIGLLCGILSAVLVSGFSILLTMFSNINPIAEFYPVLDQLGIQLSPEVEEYMTKLSDEFSQHGYSPTLAIVTFVSNLVVYPLFGTIGALIGVAVFSRKNLSPPGTEADKP